MASGDFPAKFLTEPNQIFLTKRVLCQKPNQEMNTASSQTYKLRSCHITKVKFEHICRNGDCQQLFWQMGCKAFSPLRSDRSEHIQRSLPHVTTLFQQHVHKCVLDYTEGLQQEEQAEWIAHCPISAISPDSFTKSCNSGSCSVRGQLKNLTLLCCSKFSIIRTFL